MSVSHCRVCKCNTQCHELGKQASSKQSWHLGGSPADWQPGVPCRLQRDPASHDDGSAQVPSGETGRSGGLLPAAQQHPGGSVQEGRGE